MSGNKPDLFLLSSHELDKALHDAMKTLNRSHSNSFDAISAGIKEIIDERERRIHSESKKKVSFLDGILVAFKEKMHTDIQLRPGKNSGPCIPAHRAILASRSKIFKQMLECETTWDQIITVPEMNTEELECLLEFLYSGSLDRDKMEKNVCSLFHAAHKYEIPYLQKCCECYMLDSLNASNVLDILEMSDALSSQTIMDAALKFIVENMESMAVSPEYDVFAAKSPHLSVQITRAFVNHAKNHGQKEVRLQKEVDRLHKELDKEIKSRREYCEECGYSFGY